MVGCEGFNQLEGVDYDETFTPVVKPQTIRIILTIALTRRWTIKQLDVKNAFFYGYFKESIFMETTTWVSRSASS